MSTPSWQSDAFFEEPERDSLDGGKTNHGPLWHAISPRWGHSMHTMCSYHGMFPARLAHYFIQRYSKLGDLVLDPFSGRGTVALQARVEGRRVISNDLSPLAYVLTKAKSHPPAWDHMMSFLAELERDYKRARRAEPDVSPDIAMLFHRNTLKQIVFLRNRLLSTDVSQWSPVECMLAGTVAGILHGLHRRDGTSMYLSISMPNTFSMAPAYVEKYIKEKGLVQPNQDVFKCLRDKFARLYLDSIAGTTGQVFQQDAVSLLRRAAIGSGVVDLVITSPPYLDVVNYGTANWIRLWWLGTEEVGREHGEGRKSLNAQLDHRHTYDSYREFFIRMLGGIRRVLKRNGVAVLVVGDVAHPERRESPMPLASRLWSEVGDSSHLQLLDLIEDTLPANNKVSRIWGDTKGQATERDCALVLARDDATEITADETIYWDEPYKDGGPDAAHARLKDMRQAS